MTGYRVVYGWYDDCEKQVEYFDNEYCEDAEFEAMGALSEARGWCDWCAVYSPDGEYLDGFDTFAELDPASALGI